MYKFPFDIYLLHKKTSETSGTFFRCLRAIYKTRNTGTGNGMRGMQGTQGMFTRIPGNVLILAFRGIFEKIPGNVINNSGECSRRFRGMFGKIPGNV